MKDASFGQFLRCLYRTIVHTVSEDCIARGLVEFLGIGGGGGIIGLTVMVRHNQLGTALWIAALILGGLRFTYWCWRDWVTTFGGDDC